MPEKPAGMSWESFADMQVRLAIRAGEFKDLPGAGEPIAGLDEPYRDDWWLRAYLRREDLSVPCAAFDIRAEVERGLAKIMTLTSESAVRRHVEALNVKIAEVNRSTNSGPSTCVAKLDVESVLARWREARRANGEQRPPRSH
jgi:hypothetical protein